MLKFEVENENVNIDAKGSTIELTVEAMVMIGTLYSKLNGEFDKKFFRNGVLSTVTDSGFWEESLKLTDNDKNNSVED